MKTGTNANKRTRVICARVTHDTADLFAALVAVSTARGLDRPAQYVMTEALKHLYEDLESHLRGQVDYFVSRIKQERGGQGDGGVDAARS